MIMNKCISNKTGNPVLKIGKSYQLFEHEDSKLVWVKILDKSNVTVWRTIQAYGSDFQSIESWRENRINNLFNELK